MKKPIILSSLILASLTLGGLSAVAGKAETENVLDFTRDIIALTPGNGETVNILPGNLQEFWNIENLYSTYSSRISEIDDLYTYNNELAAFSSKWGNNEATWAVYDKYDSFKPVNNVLTWKSSLDAVSYDVRISQDNKLSRIEREYTVDGNTNSVTLENPYTGVTYYWQVTATLEDGTSKKSDIFSFNTEATTRTISLHGVSNTRDWGGYLTDDGSRTMEGLCYRGSRLDDYDPDDQDELNNHLAIKTDLDLRGVEGRQNATGRTYAYSYSCPYYTGHSAGLDSETGDYQKNLGNAIKVFADANNYPIYFHCSVGRDRTGAVSLILNLLSGVSIETAMKEFLTSMFSVTGAWSKGSTGFYDNYRNYINYFNTFSGSTMAEKVENYLVTHCDVTHEEIVSIVNILKGNTKIDVANSTDNDEYADQSRITYVKDGNVIATKMVRNGSLVPEIALSEEGLWRYGDEVVDFSEDLVSEDMVLTFEKTVYCNVAFHVIGRTMTQSLLTVKKGTIIEFADYEAEGMNLTVVYDDGSIIENLQVSRDCTVNLIYTEA